MYEIIDNDYEDEEEYDNPDIMLEEANPEYSEIITDVVNPMASDAMSLAGQYRGEGMDASSALRQAWADVKGEDNPDFQPNLLTLALVAAGIFVAVWKWRKGYWPWRDLLGNKAMGRRQIARPRPNPGTANPGMATMSPSPAQLGRTWTANRSQSSSQALTGGLSGYPAQPGGSGQWPHAV